MSDSQTTPTPGTNTATISDKAKTFVSHPSMKWLGGALALTIAGLLGYSARGVVEKRRSEHQHQQLTLSTGSDGTSATSTM